MWRAATAHGARLPLQNVSDLIGDIVSTGRSSQRTFVEILGDTACAEALAPPPRSLGRAYEDMAVAVETGDEYLAEAAGEDLTRAGSQLEEGPSGADSLKHYCAPNG